MKSGKQQKRKSSKQQNRRSRASRASRYRSTTPVNNVPPSFQLPRIPPSFQLLGVTDMTDSHIESKIRQPYLKFQHNDNPDPLIPLTDVEYVRAIAHADWVEAKQAIQSPWYEHRGTLSYLLDQRFLQGKPYNSVEAWIAKAARRLRRDNSLLSD